jgi:hypothetical protein
LVEDGLITEVEFAQVVDNFYNTFLEYIENWGKPFEDLHHFKFALLNNAPSWHEVQKFLQNTVKVDTNVLKVVDDDLFNEVDHVRNICAAKIETWKKCGVKTSERWTETFQIMKNENISFRNIMNIVTVILAIPGTNASSKRVFSLMKAVWSDERNQLSVQTVKAISITKCHFKDISCMDFYSFLKERPTLLQEIQS